MQPGYGQPPYGDSSQPPQTAYPQQELLPQEVKPSGSRVPLVVGLVVALALVGGGIAAWLLLRNNDESTRAQYCAAIKRLLPNGDLTSSLGGGQQDVVAKLSKVADLAPSTVAGDWKTLTDLVHSSQQSGTPDVTLVLGAIGAARNIVADSNDHCGTTFTVPSVP
jgi:hypothetical protein